MTKKGLLA